LQRKTKLGHYLPLFLLEDARLRGYAALVKALNGHFDGKHIVLDDPIALKPNTRVRIIAVEDGSPEADIIRGCTRLSEFVFQQIWDNPLDADYDKL
jgi:hypothetical protein